MFCVPEYMYDRVIIDSKGMMSRNGPIQVPCEKISRPSTYTLSSGPSGNSAGGQEQKELLLLWALLRVELHPSKRYVEILTPSTYERNLILK